LTLPGRYPPREYSPPRKYAPRGREEYHDCRPGPSYYDSPRVPGRGYSPSRSAYLGSSCSHSRSHSGHGHGHGSPRANQESYMTRRPGEREAEMLKKEKKVLGMSRAERAEMQTQLAKVHEKEVKRHDKKVARLESTKKFAKHVAWAM
jgi:hypothetical protein